MLEPVVPTAPAASATVPVHPHSGFRELLSELNPLQYLPVIGTVYRAITGDTIPEDARTVGSLVVGGLTGGPVGVAINLVAMLAEKITGIDPEAIGSSVLADMGIGHHPAAPLVATLFDPPKASPAAAPAPPPVPSAGAWSPAQLKSYGVTTTPDGTLHHGAVSGADVLNDLELARLNPVAAPG